MSEESLPPRLPGLEPNRVWLAESARVTAFTVPGTTPALRKWRDIFGSEPDQVVRQPGMPSVEGGSIERRRWLVTHQPDRVDIVVGPETPSAPPTDLLNIGEFQTIIDSLLKAAGRTFDRSASIQRVAVGAMLFEPVDTIREGLRTLQSIVPQLQRLPEGTTDLLFQLNVPMSTDDPVQGLLINRLLKWQVSAVQLFGVVPGPGMSLQLLSTGLRSVVRLELDINTAPERTTPIPNDKLEELILRLGGIAKDIARAGGVLS